MCILVHAYIYGIWNIFIYNINYTYIYILDTCKLKLLFRMQLITINRFDSTIKQCSFGIIYILYHSFIFWISFFNFCLVYVLVILLWFLFCDFYIYIYL